MSHKKLDERRGTRKPRAAFGLRQECESRGLYHSGNILRFNNTICDGIVMWLIFSGAKLHPDFQTGL
jgi:hypothetical protein